MLPSTYSYKKGERLRKKKFLDRLFLSKNTFLCYPFKVIYTFIEEEQKEFLAQLLISIPKKRIKKAVDRNLLKRRTKEAYRLNKDRLYKNLAKEENLLALGIIYVADKKLPYKDIYEAIILILDTLSSQINTKKEM